MATQLFRMILPVSANASSSKSTMSSSGSSRPTTSRTNSRLVVRERSAAPVPRRHRRNPAVQRPVSDCRVLRPGLGCRAGQDIHRRNRKQDLVFDHLCAGCWQPEPSKCSTVRPRASRSRSVKGINGSDVTRTLVLPGYSEPCRRDGDISENGVKAVSVPIWSQARSNWNLCFACVGWQQTA